MGCYSISISSSLRRRAFELRLDLILLQKVRRQPLGLDHIKKIFSCISSYIHIYSCISPSGGRPMGCYLISISSSLRRGAFKLRLDLILLRKVRRQPLGLYHIKKIFSCISSYGGKPMDTYSISISITLRRGAFKLRLDLILLRNVCRQPLGLDHIKKIVSCISPYGGKPMSTYSISISTSLRKGAIELRLDLIFLRRVHK